VPVACFPYSAVIPLAKKIKLRQPSAKTVYPKYSTNITLLISHILTYNIAKKNYFNGK